MTEVKADDLLILPATRESKRSVGSSSEMKSPRGAGGLSVSPGSPTAADGRPRAPTGGARPGTPTGGGARPRTPSNSTSAGAAAAPDKSILQMEREFEAKQLAKLLDGSLASTEFEMKDVDFLAQQTLRTLAEVVAALEKGNCKQLASMRIVGERSKLNKVNLVMTAASDQCDALFARLVAANTGVRSLELELGMEGLKLLRAMASNTVRLATWRVRLPVCLLQFSLSTVFLLNRLRCCAEHH